MSLIEKARNHWKAHRPKAFREMQESGKLEEMLVKAVENYKQEWNDLTENGMHPHEAEEAALPNWIYLPPENLQPNLGETPPLPQEPDSMTVKPPMDMITA